jgi:protein-disulfide isomerase
MKRLLDVAVPIVVPLVLLLLDGCAARVSPAGRAGGPSATQAAAATPAASPPARPDAGTPTTEPWAVVDGQPITEADVRAEQQRNPHVLERCLDRVVQQRLLASEAAVRKTTSEALLADLVPTPVTDADIDAFYEQRKASIGQPKEEVVARIRKRLEAGAQDAARAELYQRLEAAHRVERRAEPIRTPLAVSGPAKGPATAPVTIIEFSDFQCTYCKQLNGTLEELQQRYGDRLRIVFRQFPMPFHGFAAKAAEASLCAAEQNHFWQLHDAMFAHQDGLAVEQLRALATGLNLDAAAFSACLDSGAQAKAVAADVAAGTAAGVRGTPVLFVNGRAVIGAAPSQEIAVVIDDELRRASGRVTPP